MKLIASLTLLLYHHVSSSPLTAATVDPAECNSPCGMGKDCPSLTCIPVAANCTDFGDCAGTCQDLSASKQQIYSVCGGWGLIDDCDERIESCTSDPRRSGCGPECDGPGICLPLEDYCGGDTDQRCGEGKVCFKGSGVGDWGCVDGERSDKGYSCWGKCLPLRFGSDGYAKSREVEVARHDQDGNQRDDDGPG
jgi:hypothetical protein